MRGIATADKATADALRAKVDAAYGYPRCDRLSGTLEAPADVLARLSCPCKVATAPDPACHFQTTAQALPVQTDTGWAYPVDDAMAETLAALSKAEKGAIAEVAEKGAIAEVAEKTAALADGAAEAAPAEPVP